MRFVDCGDEPSSLRPLVKYNAAGDPVWEPKGEEYSDFIKYLENRFSSLCGYCEKPCQGSQPGKPDSNEVDHFQPRDHFPGLTFTWENLIYVCRQCNQAKGNQWPGLVPLPDFVIDAFNNEARNYGKRFIAPSQNDGYVNPRDSLERAETFFVFNHLGEILPNLNLDDQKWSKARRTIRDFALNPVGGPRAEDLCTMRKAAFQQWEDVALEAARGRTRNARRMLDSLDKVRPGFPSFVDWAFSNALSQS